MVSKETKKTRKTTTKKVSRKKKSTAKKATVKKARSTPFKSKLGHDPLAWITGDDAADLGISYDEIESRTEATLKQLDQVIPAEEPVEKNPGINEQEAIETETAVVPLENTDTKIADQQPSVEDMAAQGWGLFDDEPEDETTEIKQETVSDGSWGLFDEEESSLPVGEGVAWGLFSDEDSVAEVEHDAIVIPLPEAFTVASVSKLYHDIDLQIHENHDMVLDAKDVETIDAAGLQLLFAVQKELKRHDCRLVLKDANEKLEVLSKSSFINDIVGMSG